MRLDDEWSRTDADYATRVAHLQGTPGGLNGTSFLTAQSIFIDSAVDALYGDGGVDWFFAEVNDTNHDIVKDETSGETVTALT